jgi:hypothetical protein
MAFRVPPSASRLASAPDHPPFPLHLTTRVDMNSLRHYNTSMWNTTCAAVPPPVSWSKGCGRVPGIGGKLEKTLVAMSSQRPLMSAHVLSWIINDPHRPSAIGYQPFQRCGWNFPRPAQ